MSGHSTLFSNYVTALLSGVDATQRAQLFDDVIRVVDVMQSNHDLWLALNRPLVQTKKKMGILNALCGAMTVHPRVHNLFILLIKNDRANCLPDFIEFCKAKKDELDGVVPVHVVSVKPFNEMQMQRLSAAMWIDDDHGRFSFSSDETLMAGFKVFIKNSVYDLSLKSVMSEFKEIIRQR